MSVLARYLGAVSERVPERKKEREVVLHQRASAICIQRIDVEIDVLTVPGSNCNCRSLCWSSGRAALAVVNASSSPPEDVAGGQPDRPTFVAIID